MYIIQRDTAKYVKITKLLIKLNIKNYSQWYIIVR